MSKVNDTEMEKDTEKEELWSHLYSKIGRPKFCIGDKVKDTLTHLTFTIYNIIPMQPFYCWGYAFYGETLYISETDLELVEKTNEHD